MNKTIVCIEDNPHNARLFKKLLQKYPHNTLLCEDGHAGLKALEEHDVDIIFLDVNLPDINGMTLVKRLKSNTKYQHIPVVALTANAMAGDREMCLDAGFDDYVAKPIMRNELYFHVDKYLA